VKTTTLLVTVWLGLASSLCPAEDRSDRKDEFVNPIMVGADPWVIRHQDKYVWCATDGDRGIALHVSGDLTKPGPKRVVWSAPEQGPVSRQVWAPEIHFLDDRFHIYFAASDGKNENHLAYVLRSESEDPLSRYSLHGPFPTGSGGDGKSPNVWAIDMTVLEHQGKRYAIWSGWDARGTDRQFLYIALMKDPITFGGRRKLLCNNADYVWERTEENLQSRGLCEAPQVLKHRNKVFLTYSCAASWLPTYKLGLLELIGDDPLDPAVWKKHGQPIFESTPQTFGVGHSCFVSSPDQSEWWHIFHAKLDQSPGWHRRIFLQPFTFGQQSLPEFGKPLSPGSTLLRPSGTPVQTPPSLPIQLDLREQQALHHFSYFGHQLLTRQQEDGIHLGAAPRRPIKDRTGEKLLLNALDISDFKASTVLRIVDGERDAGLLFRTSAPSVGYDAQKGYFAGLVPGTDLLVLGKMDGKHWAELKRASLTVESGHDYRLTVSAIGPQLRVAVDGELLLEHRDDTYPSGSIGLRVVNTHAVFRSLKITES
jgi:GH43 family beta-xylosidase